MRFIDKYSPASVEEFIGNAKVATDLKNYAWTKPAILHGAVGVGKSALAQTIARDLDLELIYITDDNIASGKNIAESTSLFGNRKLLVFDDVDKLKAIKEVPEILDASKNPTLLVTSDFDSKRLATVKKRCDAFQMRKPMTVSIVKHLEKIAAAEGIEAEKALLTEIAEKSGGDIRAAVGDFETALGGKKKLEKADLEVIGARDVSVDIYKTLSTILMRKNIKESLQSIYDVDEQPGHVLLWIDENLPAIYKGPVEIEKSYHYLSRADIFMGRITSKQYWGFLRYSNPLMTSGVTASRGEKINFTRLQFPFYLIRMGQTKKQRALKKSIGEKMSPSFHCSGKEIANQYIPLYRKMLAAKRVNVKELVERFKFEDEEIEYLEEK